MLTYITIDWDFFVPEEPLWDFQHKESPLYLTTLWTNRVLYFRKMRTNGAETDFWSKLWDKLPLPVHPVIRVSDSHLSVWHDTMLHLAKTVVLIDQHHDMFDNGTSSKVDCGNWLSTWLRNKRNRRAIWVKADHSREGFLNPKFKYLNSRVTILDKVDQLDPNQLQNPVLHVCRSGCWTPPWLDAAFIRFIQASNLKSHVLDQEWCDPLKPRFSLREYRSAWQQRRIIIAQLQQFYPDRVIPFFHP